MTLSHALDAIRQILRLEGPLAERDGCVSVAIEGVGPLQIHEQEDGILLLLGRQDKFTTVEHLEHALAVCDPREKWPFPLHAGWQGQDLLVYACFIPSAEITAPNVEASLHSLERAHELSTVTTA